MDLFVYGCSRVLRYFSLISHTAVLYYMKGILEELDMTQTDFKEICVNTVKKNYVIDEILNYKVFEYYLK